ncbi:MAG: methyltransferase domain-containing (seleno)protein, partial [Saprospiraceae bacterium]
MKTIAQNFSVHALREAIRQEYCEVAQNPQKGFHFLSGRPLVKTLGYT